jgi:hypothetical protein
VTPAETDIRHVQSGGVAIAHQIVGKATGTWPLYAIAGAAAHPPDAGRRSPEPSGQARSETR